MPLREGKAAPVERDVLIGTMVGMGVPVEIFVRRVDWRPVDYVQHCLIARSPTPCLSGNKRISIYGRRQLN